MDIFNCLLSYSLRKSYFILLNVLIISNSFGQIKVENDSLAIKNEIGNLFDNLIHEQNKICQKPILFVGFNAGANTVFVNTTPLFIPPYSNKKPINAVSPIIGIDLGYYITKRVVLGSGFYYSEYKYSVESSHDLNTRKYVYNEKISTVGMPVYLKWYFLNKINVFTTLGLNIEHYFNSNAVLNISYPNYGVPDSKAEINIETKNINVLPAVSLGYTLKKASYNFDLELKYMFVAPNKTNTGVFGSNEVELAYLFYMSPDYSYYFNNISVLLRFNFKIFYNKKN